MPFPSLSATWIPTPAMVRAGARTLGKTLREFYMDDLERSGWAKDTKDMFIKRTQQGRGLTGPSPPLSPAYAAIKGSSVRDLTVTSSLMDAVVAPRVAGKDEFLVFLTGQHGPSGLSADILGLVHHRGRKAGVSGSGRAFGSIPAANWFGLSAAEEVASIGVGQLIFDKVTFPRALAAFERGF